MKEINEAYETIRTQRKAAQSGQSYGGYPAGTARAITPEHTAACAAVRLAISQGI